MKTALIDDLKRSIDRIKLNIKELNILIERPDLMNMRELLIGAKNWWIKMKIKEQTKLNLLIG